MSLCCNTGLAALYFSRVFCTVSVGTDCDFSSSLVVRSCVLHHRPSDPWAGLVPIDSVGVFRCANTARYRSLLVSLAFHRSRLASLTAASALPFVCWCPGLPGLCSKSHSLAKLLNFSQANCGPLSLMTMSGMPCLAKWHFSFLMMVLVVVLGRCSISQKFEK